MTCFHHSFQRDGRLAGGKGWKERVYNREEWKKLSLILHIPMEWMNEYMHFNIYDVLTNMFQPVFRPSSG
jgi:hypothetical protein